MITIYGKQNCQYCVQAQQMAQRKGVQYEYKKLGVDYHQKDVDNMVAATRHRSFPFIYDGLKFIGGAEQLHKHFKTIL